MKAMHAEAAALMQEKKVLSRPRDQGGMCKWVLPGVTNVGEADGDGLETYALDSWYEQKTPI
jgi:hypothetical protein